MRTIALLILWVPTVILWTVFAFLFKILYQLNGTGIIWKAFGVMVSKQPIGTTITMKWEK